MKTTAPLRPTAVHPANRFRPFTLAAVLLLLMNGATRGTPQTGPTLITP